MSDARQRRQRRRQRLAIRQARLAGLPAQELPPGPEPPEDQQFVPRPRFHRPRVRPPEPQPPQPITVVPPEPTPFVSPKGKTLWLRDLYQGSSLFLALSGPSLSRLDLSLLNQRGIIVMAVNQAPAVVRPQLWVHVDQGRKFHEGIWRDPAILKFCPARPGPHGVLKRGWFPGSFNQPLQRKLPDGRFVRLPMRVGDAPGVVGYQRSANFNPETWLSETTINWGNSENAAKRNGHPHSLNVMFAAVKLAYVLGFRRVYLLGCDFHMDRSRPYAFAQAKGRGGVSSNNHTYLKLNRMFGALRPKFEAAGFWVFNCNPDSAFATFDHVSYRDALSEARREMPAEPWDVAGWYETVENKGKAA